MEEDQTPIQEGTSSPDDDHGDDANSSPGQTTQSRSYECNFCRRGFSNAQALGGHMNIHRKEKAKIKQQQSSSKQPTTANKSNVNPQQQQLRTMIMENPRTTTTSSPPTKIQQSEFVMSTIDDGSYTMIGVPAWALPPPKVNRSKEYTKLQLFDETPARSESTTTYSRMNSSPPELDLELRLGPEPCDSSSSPTELGTKKFF